MAISSILDLLDRLFCWFSCMVNLLLSARLFNELIAVHAFPAVRVVSMLVACSLLPEQVGDWKLSENTT